MAPTLPPGMRVLDRYTLELPLEETPIGRVYLALGDPPERQLYRVHVLRRELLRRRPLAEAFARQAVLLAGLSHPGLERVVDSGVDWGVPLVVAPHRAGATLRASLLRTPGGLPRAEVVRVVGEVGAVLGYLHGRATPVLHRALDPTQIALAEADGAVTVLGAGRVQSIEAAIVATRNDPLGERPAPPVPRAEGAYRAPEEDRAGAPVGAAADQYSLASIAYECLVGRPPPPSPGAPPAGPKIPPAALTVLARARNANASARWPSVAAFVDALVAALPVTGEAVATRVAGPVVAPPAMALPALAAPAPVTTEPSGPSALDTWLNEAESAAEDDATARTDDDSEEPTRRHSIPAEALVAAPAVALGVPAAPVGPPLHESTATMPVSAPAPGPIVPSDAPRPHTEPVVRAPQIVASSGFTLPPAPPNAPALAVPSTPIQAAARSVFRAPTRSFVVAPPPPPVAAAPPPPPVAAAPPPPPVAAAPPPPPALAPEAPAPEAPAPEAPTTLVDVPSAPPPAAVAAAARGPVVPAPRTTLPMGPSPRAPIVGSPPRESASSRRLLTPTPPAASRPRAPVPPAPLPAAGEPRAASGTAVPAVGAPPRTRLLTPTPRAAAPTAPLDDLTTTRMARPEGPAPIAPSAAAPSTADAPPATTETPAIEPPPAAIAQPAIEPPASTAAPAATGAPSAVTAPAVTPSLPVAASPAIAGAMRPPPVGSRRPTLIGTPAPLLAPPMATAAPSAVASPPEPAAAAVAPAASAPLPVPAAAAPLDARSESELPDPEDVPTLIEPLDQFIAAASSPEPAPQTSMFFGAPVASAQRPPPPPPPSAAPEPPRATATLKLPDDEPEIVVDESATPAAPFASSSPAAPSPFTLPAPNVQVRVPSPVRALDVPATPLVPVPTERVASVRVDSGVARAGLIRWAVRTLAVAIVLAAVIFTVGVVLGRNKPAAVVAPAAGATQCEDTTTPTRSAAHAAAVAPPSHAESVADVPAATGAPARENEAPARPARRRAPAVPMSPNEVTLRRARAQIAERIAACPGHHGRHARVAVRYAGPSGRAQAVRIAGAYFARAPRIRQCIEQAARAVELPPFRRRVFTWDYSFWVP